MTRVIFLVTAIQCQIKDVYKLELSLLVRWQSNQQLQVPFSIICQTICLFLSHLTVRQTARDLSSCLSKVCQTQSTYIKSTLLMLLSPLSLISPQVSCLCCLFTLYKVNHNQSPPCLLFNVTALSICPHKSDPMCPFHPTETIQLILPF